MPAAAYVNPAVYFTAPKTVELQDRGDLTPVTGQLLIRNSRSMISTGTELTLLSGESRADSVWGQITHFPETPGYCSVGEVVKVGPEVPADWLGARVVSGAWASHARYALARLPDLDRVPAAVSDDEAVFGTINRIVMNGVRRAGVGLGDCVVIYGLGLLGQLAARLCALSGATRVIGVDPSALRRGYLTGHPALQALDPADGDLTERVTALNHGRKADIVFEVTGVADLIPSEFAVLKAEGRFIVLSGPRAATRFDFHDLCNRHSFTIIGAHAMSAPAVDLPGNPWTPHRNNQLLMDLLQSRSLDLAGLISHRRPWQEAVELYQMLLADRSQAMAVVLDWT